MTRVPLADLPDVAREALARLPQGKKSAALVALKGELGAGKTTFAQALAKELGVAQSVQSPTYVLMKSYAVSHPRFARLIHIDAYRLENADEFKALMPETFLADPRNLVLVEWPERVEGQLPKPDLVVKFSSRDAGEGERYIEVV
jgi:tRNA threonylcarbamoyladenosine biosynthesis protein TsaE